ncbi:hypothetical protein B0H11DRAFT_1909377 [Mycena galericulata]|nr:hypothetical protein B0H11DRAFT_1909377 [Mycena galericulata]
MSAENTPILAGSIPAFELFMAAWNAMLADADLKEENISKFIDPGLAAANTYYNKMGDTDAYIIAMFINPSIRFEWIRKNWSRTDQEKAKKIIVDKATPPTLTGITQAAKRFRNAALALDFTSASRSSADQPIEDEMNHYMTSSLPARKSTDMVWYWMVRSQLLIVNRT